MTFMFVKIFMEMIKFIFLCVFCPQETMFAVEEESVTSGKGRCPFDPNSSCMSTLRSKNLIISLLISPSIELIAQLSDFSPLSSKNHLPS